MPVQNLAIHCEFRGRSIYDTTFEVLTGRRLTDFKENTRKGEKIERIDWKSDFLDLILTKNGPLVF